MSTQADLLSLARELNAAWEGRLPLEPMSERGALRDAAEAYAVQQAWSALRREHGERVMGRKIGLTSPAIQRQLGVHEPDYGELWASRYYELAGGRVVIPAAPFLQPRLEGEVAFLIGRELRGPAVTLQDVLAATEACCLAVELVDSRVADWRISLLDTVADNASYGGFTLGPWSRALRAEELRTLGLIIQRNGETVVEGVGAAALGHPARAVAWLANKLGEFGAALQPGDVVLSGSLGGAAPFAPGDQFSVELHGQPPISIQIV